jgi:proteasome lid subunit RPN8/RPN11
LLALRYDTKTTATEAVKIPMLAIPSSLYQQLLKTAQTASPFEVVGVLAGIGSVQEILPLENIAAEPTKAFVADPIGLALALRHIRTQGLELLAFYHSHPKSPPIPSKTDYAEARWDVPMLILDAQRQTARAWDLESGREIEIRLLDLMP